MNSWKMPNMIDRKDLEEEQIIVLKVIIVISKLLSRVCKDKLIG